MKKLTTSVLAVVLTSSFVMVDAQNTRRDTVKTQDIEGVVVTALGIKREQKSLGYASQQLKAEALTEGTTNTGNVASQLSGKVAGLQVNTNNNFGGSSNLVIRGYKSLKGGGPLIVIDGSPVNNNSLSGQFDYGNFLSDINQEDIESINVLKGAAASALYGERGLNGVIVITTKNGRGRNEKKWGVTLNSSANFGFIDRSTFPKYQNQYGGGYANEDFNFSNEKDEYGDYTNFNDDASLGPKYDGHMIYYWDAFDPTSPYYGKMKPYAASTSGPIDFFEIATNFTNTITLQKAAERSNFMLGYTNQMMTGIMPNSNLRKNTLSTKFGFDLTDHLTATIYSTLTLQNTKGRNETGYSDNVISSFRQWWNTDTSIRDQRDAYFRSGGQNVTWNRNSPDDPTVAYWNNPYFQRYKNYQSDDRLRSFSYAMLNYKVNDHWNLTTKLSYDFLKMLIEQRLANGSGSQSFGNSGNDARSGYSKQNIATTENNFDLFANYKYDITDNLDISGVIGGNVRRNHYSSDYSSTEGGLVIPNLFALSNSASPVLAPSEREEKYATAGIYATASLGFADTYFLDGTYRIDRSSNLPKDNNTYGYGSVTGAIVLSNLIKANWLNFWKIRGNYAVVGGSTGPYQLKNSYSTRGIMGGNVLYDVTAIDNFGYVLANSQLKPERSKETEVGMEMQFFKRRFGFDIAVYQSQTTDQIIRLPISSATGWAYKVFNAGRIDNKGVEVQLNLTPIRTRDFSWDINANWAKNRNEVVDLNGPDNYLLANYQGGVSLQASKGQPFGTLIGTDYVYDDKGNRVVTSPDANGLGGGMWAKTAPKVIGNVTPDWTGGVRNTFSYKGLSLGFLIDVQKGGNTYSTDMLYGLTGGLYAETVSPEFRDPANVILKGVYANGQPNTTPIGGYKLDSKGNKVPVRSIYNYYSYQPQGYNNAPNSEFIYDTSYVKLREANISYKLPKSMIENINVEDVSVGLVGRNLWIIHKNIPYADPEAGVGGGLRSRGNSIGILPTTRDIGVNVSIKF